MFFSYIQDTGPAFFREIPYPPQELPKSLILLFIQIIREINPFMPVTLPHAINAQQSVNIKKQNQISRFHSHLQSFMMVSVYNPFPAAYVFPVFLLPFLLRRISPAGLPAFFIQINNRISCFFSQPLSRPALTASGISEKHDSFIYFPLISHGSTLRILLVPALFHPLICLPPAAGFSFS